MTIKDTNAPAPAGRTTRRALLQGLAMTPALAIAPAAAIANPDAELIAMCAKRCEMQEDEDRRWQTYLSDQADYDEDEANVRIGIMNSLIDQIREATPKTLAGL